MKEYSKLKDKSRLINQYDKMVKKGININQALKITNYREWNALLDAKTTSNASMKGQQSLLRNIQKEGRFEHVQLDSIIRLKDSGIQNPEIIEVYIKQGRELFDVVERYEPDDDDDWDDWDDWDDDDYDDDDETPFLEIPQDIPVQFFKDSQVWQFERAPRGWTQKLSGTFTLELSKLSMSQFKALIEGQTMFDKLGNLIFLNNISYWLEMIEMDTKIIEKALAHYYRDDDIEKSIGLSFEAQLKCPKERNLIDREFSKISAVSETYTSYVYEKELLLDSARDMMNKVKESCNYYIWKGVFKVYLYNRF